MVEHRLPKPAVAGSIPVSRSKFLCSSGRTTTTAFTEGLHPKCHVILSVLSIKRRREQTVASDAKTVRD